MSHLTTPDSSLSRLASDDVKLTGYENDFIPPLDNKYECPICLLALRDPFQTNCGHRFCRNCILKWLRDEERGKKCPNCNEILREHQLFADNFAKREILGHNVYCLHYRNGCQYQTQLSHIEDHQESCRYAIEECPNGCGERMLKGEIEEHIEDKCTRRTELCQYCKDRKVVSEMKTHEDSCPLAEVECQHCGISLSREQIKRHLSADCIKMVVNCPFGKFGCKEKVTRDELAAHFDESTQLHLRMVGAKVLGLMSMSTTNPSEIDPNQDIYSSFTTGEAISDTENSDESPSDPLMRTSSGIYHKMEPFKPPESPEATTPNGLSSKLEIINLEEQERFGTGPSWPTPRRDDMKHDSVENLAATFGKGEGTYPMALVTAAEEVMKGKNKIRELERESAQSKQYVVELQAKMAATERLNLGLQQKITDVEGRCCGGVYIWKLSNYSQRRLQATQGHNNVLHSEGFYTSYYGYKMCIRLNLNGVDSAQGTHISLFIHLLQGDYDDVVQWPFTGTITLSILDQTPHGRRSHITETLVAKPSLAAFQRPTGLRNHKGFGYMEFAPLNYLESHQFIYNDTLIIRADVKSD